MKFEINNRWTGKLQWECELDAEFAGKSYGVQLGAAVKMASLRDADLRDADLSDADLSDADLRGANLSGANLRDADLSDADLRGADLRDASLRDADLRDASLSGADLRDANLRDAGLSGANLRDADLRGANLRDAGLRDADLRGANLSDADLRDVPKIPDIHKAIYEAASKPNALDMSVWHACETTHCRAGWVIALAGDAGRAMEFCMGTPAAAAFIYLASDPKLEKIPNFYATNEKALADMKRLAERQ